MEKLFIDAFLYPEHFANFEEIENLFKTGQEIDVDLLKSYLKKLNSNKVWRQVGYLLEKYKKADVYESTRINKNYYVLNPFLKTGKMLNKKWRLML